MRDTMPTPPPSRTYRTPSRLAQRAARELGMRPQSVEQLIHGHTPIGERFAALVRLAVECDDAAVYAKLMAPLERVESLTLPAEGEARSAARLADAEEDVAEALQERAPGCRRALRRLLTARARERFTASQHDRVLAAQAGMRL